MSDKIGRNGIIIVNKPSNISSNKFLQSIKRKYNIKTAGYSGTLDPFAKGILMIAFGFHTRLLPHIKKSTKTYRATLWLGAKSDSGDTENIQSVDDVDKVDFDTLQSTINSMIGDIEYIPPSYSAKWIDGQRAYYLARRGMEVKLKPSIMNIKSIKLISYCHPFISFELEISEGGYVRSVAGIIAERLGTFGILSSLERTKEGDFTKNDFKIDIRQALKHEIITLKHLRAEFLEGKILSGKKDFDSLANAKFVVWFDDFFSIIEKNDDKIKYIINRMPIC